MKLENYLHALTERAAMERLAGCAGDAGERHRSELAVSLRRRLGDFPAEPKDMHSLAPQLLERVSCDGYTRERVEISTLDGLRMAMYVLVPDGHEGKPVPAVVACHGHGYGSREIAGLEPDGTERSGEPGLHKDFAVELVKEGYVVAAPELIGFGDRRLEEDKAAGPGKNSCFSIAAHLLLTGKTIAGLRVYETSRAVDYLLGRSEVDPTRVGIMGISGGGLVAGFTAALDGRIQCAVISGYSSLFAESILARNHCLDNYIPGVLLDAEMPDLLGLIAPRGLFLESGSEDRVFPRGPAQKAFIELQSTYSAMGASDSVQADFFEGGHEIHGAPAYAWLRKQLAN